MEFMVEQGCLCRWKRLGLPDRFAVQGAQQELQHYMVMIKGRSFLWPDRSVQHLKIILYESSACQ